jgi:hypothetical protein
LLFVFQRRGLGTVRRVAAAAPLKNKKLSGDTTRSYKQVTHKWVTKVGQ